MACCHIVGFSVCATIHLVPGDPEYPDLAWCDVCEAARMKDRGWYEYADSIAQWSWLCQFCLKDAAHMAGEVVQVANPTVTPSRRPRD